MSHYALSCLISSISSLIIGLFVYLRNRKSPINRTWGIFTLSIVIWTFGQFMESTIDDKDQALFWNKILFIGVIFIPVFFLNFMLVLQGLYGQKKKILFVVYNVSFLFLFLLLINQLIKDVVYRAPFGYYSYPSIPYYLFLSFFLSCVVYTYWFTFRNYGKLAGFKKLQMKYMIIASIIGFICGTFNFLPAFSIPTTPFVNYIFALYPLVIAYAIVRHRLMDITLAITRSGLFIAVYSLVLGIPFALAFGWDERLQSLIGEKWWMVPLVTSTVLATAGPFIYLYIQRRAEERLFQEQRRYQSTLRQASYGMGRIKDLKRLLNLIVHIVNRTVGLEHSIVYLNKINEFILGASRGQDVRFKPKENIKFDSPLIQYLVENKNPVVYEEIKQRTQDYGDHKLARLEVALKELDAAVVVPSFIDEHLIAFIVLGRKSSGRLYGDDDLAVFTILANQAALAIENAQFYEDVKKTHEQLVRAEKMATIGTMADGLSHQINNRLHALGFIAGDALDTIKLKMKKDLSPEMKEILIDLEHALVRIQDNVEQGGEVVRGLLRYTRKGEEGFTPVDLDKLIEASIEMTQFKIKKGEMIILREYPVNLPKIKGNFTQLQEVFFNIIDNAYDAMMQRKTELKEPNYKPTLKINASAQNGHINIILQDNGSGVKEEDKEKLFTPFFTTKLSSKKGTGLGLYVIQKIIEENHGGKVAYDSKYKEGTTAKIELPTTT